MTKLNQLHIASLALPQEIEQKSPNPDIQLRFSQIVSFFSAYLGIGADVVETRVRLLRRAGVPMLGAMKTGPAKHYGLPQLVQLAFAMEFVEEGISMTEAAGIVRRFWESHLAQAPDTAWRWKAKGQDDAVLAVLYRSSFCGWGDDARRGGWRNAAPDADDANKYTETHTLEVVSASEFCASNFLSSDLQLPLPYGRHRAYIINCSKMAQGIGSLLAADYLIHPSEMQSLHHRYQT